MTYTTEQHPVDTPSRTLQLEGELSIYTALEHRDRLFGQLAGCQSLELDLSQVTEMDSAGLQILLLLKREADAVGCQLRLNHHSESVFEVLELLGLQSHFGDPMVIPANWKNS